MRYLNTHINSALPYYLITTIEPIWRNAKLEVRVLFPDDFESLKNGHFLAYLGLKSIRIVLSRPDHWIAVTV